MRVVFALCTFLFLTQPALACANAMDRGLLGFNTAQTSVLVLCLIAAGIAAGLYLVSATSSKAKS